MTVQAQSALRAEDLIQSIGVGTHLDSTSGSYGDITNIEQSLAYLGVDNVRDLVPGPSPENRTIDTYEALGSFTLAGKTYTTKFDLIAGTNLPVTLQWASDMAPYVGFIEGPNEVNIVPITFTEPDGTVLTGRAAADAYQAALYADVKGSAALKNAGVMTFSLGPGTSYAGYANLSADADYADVHAYGQYGIPPYWFLENEIKAVTLAPGKPYIVTETGNYTMPNNDSGVNQDVQAKLILDTLLDDFKNGVKLTYIYQLLDPYADPNNTNAEDHYGLFSYDGTTLTPKTSAVTIHNLTSILADSGANAASFIPTRLSYAVTGLPANEDGSSFALEKSNGVYDVALWYEPWIWDKATNTEVTFASLNVTVTLGQVYQTINLYDPLTGASPIETWHNVSSVQLALNTTALILELEPDATAPAGIVIKTGAAGGVFASTGQDTITAGSGAATVNASGSATITGSSGPLAVNFSGSSASVVGGSGTLTIVSDSGHNTIVGGSGAFSYTDLAGDDRVSTGTSASNLVTLGSGSDSVTVLGATTLLGGAGASSVTLDSSGSSITGGTGGLSVLDSVGGNMITGGGGSLSIDDEGGGDLVTGGAGPLSVTVTGGDTVVGGGGALSVTSTGGDNTVSGGGGAFSYVDGDGTDLVTTGTSASNLVTLGGGSDSVTVLGATTLLGGAGASSVTLDSSGSSITGGAGGLVVTDTAGGNTIAGGNGTVSVTDSGGGDGITGGAGTLNVLDSVGGDTITGGSGAITVSAPVGGDVVTTNNTSGVSAVVLQVGTSTVTANGATAIIANRANLAVSGSGNLSINGGLGSITLTGGTGSDYVFTQAGTHNLLRLGSGADVVLGHGADTIDASTATGAANTYVYAAGPALVYGGAGALSVNGRNAAVTVIGGTGAVNASAAGDNSSLQGGSSGGNVLTAYGTNSTLVGGGNGDTLTDAGSGNNLLEAGSGNDTLYAGNGDDTLVGGGGANLFAFSEAPSPYTDVVKSFQPGSDQVSFSGFGATPIASQSVVGGNLQLVLSDHSQITFVGVTSLT